MGKGNSYVDEIRSIVKILMYILEMGMLLVSIYTGQNQSEKEEPVFQISEAQQCVWGEWKITEMNYAGAGWQECSDDDVAKNASIQFFPDKIIFNGQAAKVEKYTNEFYAVYDELSVYHWITYLESGFQGTYYVDLYADYADLDKGKCPFKRFGLLSDKKMILPAGRFLYRAEKVGGVGVEEEKPLEPSYFPGVCYGTWEVVRNAEEHESAKNEKLIGTTFITGDKLGSFVSCRVLSVKEEKLQGIIEKMDIKNNTYVVCYTLSENYYWDEMIVQDDMTALLLKGNELYWAKRKSDPEEDGIYGVVSYDKLG